ncbi:rhomboid family protein [Colletotrichum truncatum]|uniref:Rhomboid family protein n=1 Tax=Colletotrichum truncatum TaxID=5467 RepID=A0ACC3ZDL9_COLTU|nr:rhomboid family protein [Colletotrichum truncatum]KAF6794741.1 rhomboid family protein [Colletotrichum truncatum]
MASFSSLRYLGRMDPKSLGPVWTVIFYGVPTVNVAIHLAWLLVLHPAFASLWLPFNRRRLSDFLHKNFMLRPYNLHPLTLITSAFSHIQPLHLFVNLSTYNTYAENLYMLGISPLRFAILALGSGIAASMTYVLNARRPRTRKSNSGSTAVGASGILTGLGTALAVMFPTMKVRLSGTEVVLPLRTVLVGMFALDAICLGIESETGVGHAGHLGGALFGLAYAMVRKSMRCWNP